jgi:retinol dehydrogenase 14
MPTGGSMAGRVCLVTGATTGIGKAAAEELARLGARVGIVARDPARGQAAASDVEAAGDGQQVDLFVADLSSQASVHRLAEQVHSRYERLHVLVNNAGVSLPRRRVTADGLEMTLAVNHLAPFLVTNLLLEQLQASAPARVVTVSSRAERQGHIDFDDLQAERGYNRRVYSNSKLANVLFTYELARRLQGRGVTANCLHPGVVRTELARDERPGFRLLLLAMWPFLKTPEQGAATTVYLAASPEVAGVSGQFFANRQAVRSSPRSYDRALAERLWRVSEELTGLRQR